MNQEICSGFLHLRTTRYGGIEDVGQQKEKCGRLTDVGEIEMSLSTSNIQDQTYSPLSDSLWSGDKLEETKTSNKWVMGER
jgi:hypothetical protein